MFLSGNSGSRVRLAWAGEMNNILLTKWRGAVWFMRQQQRGTEVTSVECETETWKDSAEGLSTEPQSQKYQSKCPKKLIKNLIMQIA